MKKDTKLDFKKCISHKRWIAFNARRALIKAATKNWFLHANSLKTHLHLFNTCFFFLFLFLLECRQYPYFFLVFCSCTPLYGDTKIINIDKTRWFCEKMGFLTVRTNFVYALIESSDKSSTIEVQFKLNLYMSMN